MKNPVLAARSGEALQQVLYGTGEAIRITKRVRLVEDALREEYRNGIRAAAGFVADFDRQVDHHVKLSDCILFKFNMTSRKPRRNHRCGHKQMAFFEGRCTICMGVWLTRLMAAPRRKTRARCMVL